MTNPDHQRCTVCQETELAQVRDARPSQLLPIPPAALTGFPQGTAHPMLTRRRLLATGAGGIAAIYGPRLLHFDEVWQAAVADAATNPAPRCLVVLYLGGGNDGLGVIVPNATADYARYRALRPVLHRGQGPSLPGRAGSWALPGSGGELALANAVVSNVNGGDNGDPLLGLDTLYGDGSGGVGSNLAVLPATDYTPPNLSHFESSDYWFGGEIGRYSTGWLGRWLDRYGSASNPLQAVSFGDFLSKSIRTARNPVCAVSDLSSFGFSFSPTDQIGADLSGVDANAAVERLAATPAGNPQLAVARSAFAETVALYRQTVALGAPTLGVGYPATGSLAPQLQSAAFLLAAGLGTRIITIDWGGFDTHGGQLAAQDPQLVELSRCLGAFQADLKLRGIDGQVATVVFSEFGRRVQENGSAGTDHGAGGLMMLAGTPVKGGYAAPFPGLASLDEDGDLLVATDFRSVYQAIIADWLGGDPAAILPGGPFPAISRRDGTRGLFK